MNTRQATLIIAVLVGCAVSARAQAPRLFFHGVSLYDRAGVEFTVNGFPFRSAAATSQPLITSDLTPYLVRGTNELRWKFSGQPVIDAPGLFRFRLERKTEGVTAVAEAFTLERFHGIRGGG